MTLEQLLKAPEAGKRIKSPSKKAYFDRCDEVGDAAVDRILKEHAEALKDASNYYIR